MAVRTYALVVLQPPIISAFCGPRSFPIIDSTGPPFTGICLQLATFLRLRPALPFNISYLEYTGLVVCTHSQQKSKIVHSLRQLRLFNRQGQSSHNNTPSELNALEFLDCP